jgi:hypothetical protein
MINDSEVYLNFFKVRSGVAKFDLMPANLSRRRTYRARLGNPVEFLMTMPFLNL